MNTIADISHELTQYEVACARFDPSRPHARAEVERYWRDGVQLWRELWPAGQFAPSSPGEFARLQATMTRVATSWLAPRYPGEPREPIYDRITNLRPADEGERLQDLMEKNSDGTLTLDENRELAHLQQFFESLQPILNAAILALPPRLS